MDFFPCCLQTVLPVVGKGTLRKKQKSGKQSCSWNWEQSLGVLMCPYPLCLGLCWSSHFCHLPTCLSPHLCAHLISLWAALQGKACLTWGQLHFGQFLKKVLVTVLQSWRCDRMWPHPLLLSPPVLFYSPKCTCLCAYFVYHAVMPLHNLNLKVLNIRQVFPSFHLRLIPEIIKLIISKVFFFILSLNFAFLNLIPLLFIIPPPLPLGTMLINSSPSLVFAFFYPSIL